MANVGRLGILRYEETFMSHNVGTGIAGVTGATAIAGAAGTASAVGGIAWLQHMATGSTPYTITASVSKGFHLAGSLDATDNDYIELSSRDALFYGSAGHQAVEIMVQFDAVGTFALNFGLNDAIGGSSTLPVECSATSFASTASTFIGFVKDFDATNDELHCFWTDDGVDTTEAIGDLRMKGMSLKANKWLWLRLETQDRGSGKGLRATFHAAQDGKHVTKEFNTTTDNDVALYWLLGVENRGAEARGIYVKAPAWEQSISD